MRRVDDVAARMSQVYLPGRLALVFSFNFVEKSY